MNINERTTLNSSTLRVINKDSINLKELHQGMNIMRVIDIFPREEEVETKDIPEEQKEEANEVRIAEEEEEDSATISRQMLTRKITITHRATHLSSKNNSSTALKPLSILETINSTKKNMARKKRKAELREEAIKEEEAMVLEEDVVAEAQQGADITTRRIRVSKRQAASDNYVPVSYTHLTLPTKRIV